MGCVADGKGIVTIKLNAGDRVTFLQGKLNLRGVVADALPLKRRRGEPNLVPVIRPRNGKVKQCNADNATQPTAMEAHTNLKVRWIQRELLRKLPD